MNASLCGDLFASESEPQFDVTGGDVTVTRQRQEPQSPVAGSFYNTNETTGDELAAERSRAKAQNAIVLAILKRSETPLTPWEVKHRCAAAGNDMWIGSVRRAITDLTKAGLLQKLPTLRRCTESGKRNREWRAVA